MVKLSSRMKAIADQVPSGQSVADIGTDHAIIPIYLFEGNFSNKIILTDSKEGPLQKARANLQRHGLLNVLTDLRMGEGLSVLKPAEVDVVIIAGMGGLLITEILSADIKKSLTFPYFILQPRTASSELRIWLNNNNFSIVAEHLAKEGSRICEIITVKPASSHLSGEVFSEAIDFEIPPLLAVASDPLLNKFVDAKISNTQAILDTLESAESADSKKRRLVLENRLTILKERKNML